MKAHDVLRELIEIGIRQDVLAKKLGCTQSSISRWLNRDRSMKLKYAVKLVKIAKQNDIRVKLENL